MAGEAYGVTIHNMHDGPLPPGVVRCDRQTPLGNPFSCDTPDEKEAVIAAYEAHVWANPELLAMIRALRGRDLACWCWPDPCHCTVIARIANS